MKKLMLAILFLGATGQIGAQDSLRLEQCYEAALNRAPVLRNEAQLRTLGDHQLARLDALRLPAITFQASGTVQSENIALDFPPQAPLQPIELPLYRAQAWGEARYLLYDGGRTEAAKAVVEATIARQQAEIRAQTDAIRQQVCLSPAQIRFLADRHFGVGCDQVLLIESASHPEADFRYRIFNPDGGEVEACGNGARCFARYVHDRGLTSQRDLVLETLGGLIRATLLDGGRVRVDMGVPRFAPEDIPFRAPATAPFYPLAVAGETWEISVLALGNPHAVLLVDDVAQAPVMRLGPLIESHERFPARVNVGFLQIVDRGHARLRVFERGAGETLACGSGACAAAVAGMRRGLLDSEVTIELPGGSLTITWPGEGHSVMMTGPATFVFEGTVEL